MALTALLGMDGGPAWRPGVPWDWGGCRRPGRKTDQACTVGGGELWGSERNARLQERTGGWVEPAFHPMRADEECAPVSARAVGWMGAARPDSALGM